MDTVPTATTKTEEDLSTYYQRIRHDSEQLCEPLEIEDYGIQTMPAVSPPKWHLAHTSWFFETLLLKPFLKEYKEFNPHFSELFNSYYDTIGSYHPRPERGLLSRPTVKDVYRYRHYIDNAIKTLLSQTDHADYEEIRLRTILGINHEQQHQELLLYDIKHIFAYNPLKPTYKSQDLNRQQSHKTARGVLQTQWIECSGGIKTIGHSGDSFAYDNESPQHKVYLEDYLLASLPVSNGEYLEFIEAGGYKKPDYWLSDAWKIINQQGWHAPLYWQKIDNQWWYMTLSGMQPIDLAAPVCHVSFFEAAAYARWLDLQLPGIRLPSEAEWELASKGCAINGNFRDAAVLQPVAAQQPATANQCQQLFGDVWEWSQSSYSAYPGYHADNGALGEYNGKFMNSQMVLRGGSCVTPADHIRASYRNFFYPHERWQFSGFRLARDIL